MIRRQVYSIALLLQFIAGLEVAPNSPCAKKCLDDPNKGNPSWTNASLTFGPDLACMDKDFVGKNATKVAKKFAECQTCMQSSGWGDEESGERDTQWFLFNNRGAADYCLFGRFAEESDDNISSKEPYKQCFSACNPIYAASDYRVKSDPESYSYCDSNGNYTSDAQNCIKCLYDGKGLTILGNIVATLKELCNTKPGKNIDLDADIYNTTQIKLSAASPNSTSTSLPPVSPSDSGSSLSKGAIAGIVLGGLVAIAAVLAGILVLLRRARKRRETKTIEMPDSGTSTAAIPNASYQYTPVREHKYAHDSAPGATRPISELPSMGNDVAELGPMSPTHGASELGTGSPYRGLPGLNGRRN
ncbi:hypothetical protein DPSP01_010213 [Paraphaeosphaeria sporulosa]|uniref:LPXTG-domain-containing protein n=1 Tax=Paraphaeosphaeria sporulosa TaxID=1460663 RepID=A0A177C686_9PLEO|nr:uncharacterized protein CC84DRAFT_1220041 [Paraphaeosphaeria sporulosa]OAG03143.1 hypothetical protein CC84DRAFT_1220041 [Paraphaeosphaeria sporulosa]